MGLCFNFGQVSLGSGNLGIFWVHNKNLFPFPVDPYGRHIEDTSDFVDCSLSHWKVWERVIVKYPELKDTGYEEVPRGRILFQRRKPNVNFGTFVIYASASIHSNKSMKLEILKAFNLDHLQCETKDANEGKNSPIRWARDEHYEPPDFTQWS